MRKSTKNIQLERPPIKKNVGAISPRQGFSCSMGHIIHGKSRVPTKSISAHCFFSYCQCAYRYEKKTLRMYQKHISLYYKAISSVPDEN